MTATRRSFLKGSTVFAATAAMPAWMPRLAFRTPAETSYAGDTLVCIFQRGGADGLSMVVPHFDTGYYAQRPTVAIAPPKASDPAAALELNGYFGLHPALRPLHALYQARALAVVHAVGSPDPTQSHFDAMDYMERGTPGEKVIPTGWLGRHLQSSPSANVSPFRAVGMGSITQASLRGPVPAVALQSIADYHLRGRSAEVTQFQATLASLYAVAPEPLAEAAASTFEAMDLIRHSIEDSATTGYQPANGAVYPEGMFGRALSTVAHLIKASVGLEVACVDIGGWDTHVGQGNAGGGRLPALLRQLGDGLGAFYLDLQDYMQRVTVVTMSEFGRRVAENSSHGTDHGHGNCMFVIGGGVEGKRVYGEWPGLKTGKLVGPGDLAITTDFRDVLAEIVEKRLLNPHLDAVFPGYTPRPRDILRTLTPD